MAGRTRLVLLDAGACLRSLDPPAGWPGNPRWKVEALTYLRLEVGGHQHLASRSA